MKVCNMCGVEKAVAEFYKSARGTPGPYCKPCHKERATRWYEAHKERANARTSTPEYKEKRRLYYQENRDRILLRGAKKREEHPDETREYQRNWQADHPGYSRDWRKKHPYTDSDRARGRERYWKNHDKQLARGQAYRATHREEGRARTHAYTLAHPEECRARVRAYLAAHPEAVRAGINLRRARKRAATIGDTAAIKAFYKWAHDAKVVKCYLCGASTKPEDRHVDHVMPLAKGGSHAVSNLAVACAGCNQRKSAKHPRDVGLLL